MTDRELNIANAETLLDDLIDSDPDRAERFIESRLAQLALKKRASERAKQAEPVAWDAKAACLKEWDNVNDPPCHPSDEGWTPCSLCAAPPADDEAVRLLREARKWGNVALRDEIDAYLAKVGDNRMIDRGA